MNIKDKRGVTGLTLILAATVVSIASVGGLYGGGGPGAIIGSTVFLGSAGGAILATELENSVTPFRKKKAVALCKEGYRGFTVSNCAEEVSKWDNDEILAYIKDDIEVPQYPMRERLGG